MGGAAHDHPAIMMRMKADDEDALKRVGIPYLIVQPSGYFSDLWEGFEMCRRGVFCCLGDGQVRFNPISLHDLGEFVVRHFFDTFDCNLTLSVGGPQVLRMLDVAEISAKIVKRKVRTIHIPIWTAKAIVALLNPFNRNLFELGQFFVGSIDYARRNSGDLTLPTFGQDILEDYFRRRDKNEN